MSATSLNPTIVIIGAGVAGLVCAKTILSKFNEKNVILLEASNRIGGRVCTSVFGSHKIEIGAQWIHGVKDNAIFSLAQSLHCIEDNWEEPITFKNISFVTLSGKILPNELNDKVFEMMEIVEEMDEEELDSGEEFPIETSIGEVVTSKFWALQNGNPIHESEEIRVGILDWIHRFKNHVDGNDSWFKTSISQQMEYIECEGNPIINWKYPFNYSTLCHIILCGCSDEFEDDNSIPDWIHFNKMVTKISYSMNGKKAMIECSDGSVYEADSIVSTLPLGVLKENHQTLFNPSLSPERVKAIENIGFGTVDKIFIEFESMWWPEESNGFNLLWDDGSKIRDNWDGNNDNLKELLGEKDEIPIWCRNLIGFYKVLHNPKCLYSWIMGPPAQLMETLSDDDLKSALMKVLQKFLGKTYNISNIVDVKPSKWYTNPFSRGSYSFRSINTAENRVNADQLAQPIMNAQNSPVSKGRKILCFAGEATHSHYFSTVHGAYESGKREAERILKAWDDVKV